MLAQLQACHLAPNTYLIGSHNLRVRNCGQHHKHQATSSICSRSSTTAAAAGPPHRGWHADYVNGLGALLSSNQLPQAVEFVESCLDSKGRVYGVAAGELLEALCAAGQHSTAWALLRRITASQGRLPLQVLHRLLKLAGQFGTVDDVLAVYQHQQQLYGFASAGAQTTLVHALLKAHSKAQPGHLLAYEAWGRLKGSGKQLDAQCLLAGVHACVCVGKFRQAEALLEPLKAAAGAAGRPMVSAYNLILKGHVAADNIDAARRTFRAMTSRGLSPDAVTFNTLISGFVKRGDTAQARSLLRMMRVEGVQPDAWTFTTLALGYGRQGQLQEMQEVIQDMQQAGETANSATYSAAIDALASTGHLQQAEELLQQLLQNQLDIPGAMISSSGSSDNRKRRSAAAGRSSMSRNSNQQVDTQGTAQALEDAAQAAALSDNVFQKPTAAAASDRQAGHSLLSFAEPDSDSIAAAGAGQDSSASMPAAPAAATVAHMDIGSGDLFAKQQQQQDVAGGTRNRQQVLRQQYNSLIKGWLHLAAAKASEQAEQQWLLRESSSSGSNSSSSSSGSSTPVGASTPQLQGGVVERQGADAGASDGNATGRQEQQSSIAGGAQHQQQRQQRQQDAQLPGPTPLAPSLRRQQPPLQQRQLPLQPAAQRAGVGLIRPVLPPSPAASSDAADGVPSLDVPSIGQPQQQQQARRMQGLSAAIDTNGNGKLPQVDGSSGGNGSNSSTDGFAAALDVLAQMQAAGVAPAADTYTLFVDYCIKVKDAAQLQHMLDAATVAGVRPDQVMLTSLIKAAWQADAHGAAVDVFQALLRITGPPGQRSSSSSRHSGSNGGSPVESRNVSSVNGSSSSAAGVAAASGSNGTAPKQQQPRQQRLSLAQGLRAYARAAADDAYVQQPPGASRSMSHAGATDLCASKQEQQQQQQQQQQADMQRDLERQLQEQMAQARQEQQQDPQADAADSGLWDLTAESSKHQQQQQRRSSGQLLLPLSAPIGPDTAAWNALVAAMVRAGQLDDAAVALERSTQASAAAGASRPPVEGYSALIRGYRRSGLKHKAVGLLRQFLNLGGRPGRVMCDDVITLCLEAQDIKTARQVVRAMELTGCLDADGSAFYDGWFRRWELQQQQMLLPRHLQQSVVSRGSSASARPSSSSSQPELEDASGARPVAVERLKWWLGLPNSYYKGEGDKGHGGGPPSDAGREQ